MRAKESEVKGTYGKRDVMPVVHGGLVGWWGRARCEQTDALRTDRRMGGRTLGGKILLLHTLRSRVSTSMVWYGGRYDTTP